MKQLHAAIAGLGFKTTRAGVDKLGRVLYGAGIRVRYNAKPVGNGNRVDITARVNGIPCKISILVRGQRRIHVYLASLSRGGVDNVDVFLGQYGSVRVLNLDTLGFVLEDHTLSAVGHSDEGWAAAADELPEYIEQPG